MNVWRSLRLLLALGTWASINSGASTFDNSATKLFVPLLANISGLRCQDRYDRSLLDGVAESFVLVESTQQCLAVCAQINFNTSFKVLNGHGEAISPHSHGDGSGGSNNDGMWRCTVAVAEPAERAAMTYGLPNAFRCYLYDRCPRISMEPVDKIGVDQDGGTL